MRTSQGSKVQAAEAILVHSIMEAQMTPHSCSPAPAQTRSTCPRGPSRTGSQSAGCKRRVLSLFLHLHPSNCWLRILHSLISLTSISSLSPKRNSAIPLSPTAAPHRPEAKRRSWNVDRYSTGKRLLPCPASPSTFLSILKNHSLVRPTKFVLPAKQTQHFRWK